MLLLFIGESLGMQELIMIGVIALIIFGPRKLPQIARTIGKTMAEFRKATSEFRNTWEKEVEFESLESDDSARSISNTVAKDSVAPPAIRAVDTSEFENIPSVPSAESASSVPEDSSTEDSVPSNNDKRDWL